MSDNSKRISSVQIADKATGITKTIQVQSDNTMGILKLQDADSRYVGPHFVSLLKSEMDLTLNMARTLHSMQKEKAEKTYGDILRELFKYSNEELNELEKSDKEEYHKVLGNLVLFFAFRKVIFNIPIMFHIVQEEKETI
jgi:hypothetical protein